MGKLLLITGLVFTIFFGSFSVAQDQDTRELNILSTAYDEFLANGDFMNAEKAVMRYLQHPLTEYQKGRGYGKLAAVYVYLERYNDAMIWFKKMEDLKLDRYYQDIILGYSYIGQAIISEKKRSYYKAIELTEKAIRIYEPAASRDKYFLQSLSAADHNLGTYFVEIGQFEKALGYLKLSMKIKSENGFPDKGITYISLAKAYHGLKDQTLAESNFRNCIETSIAEFGENYYRLPTYYFDYGEFLQNNGRIKEAEKYFRTGLTGCLKIFGEKNNQTSKGFNLMGRNYILKGNIDSSLYYYQRSLISIVDDFNETDITKNPDIDSSILDVRLMENLKGKSEALELLASKQTGEERIKSLNLSLETIEPAMDLIDVIRNNYPTEETMLYLAVNQKQTFLTALRIASQLNSIHGNDEFLERMYSIVLRAKAAVLRNQIAGNNLLFSSALPDTLRNKLLQLSGNIAGYNKFILEEQNKPSPDTSKLNIWKDELFEMNKEDEKLSANLGEYIPRYDELLNKTSPVPVSAIQKKIENDETMIDYFISKNYDSGKRRIYIFVINRGSLNYVESDVDSIFALKAHSLKLNNEPAGGAGESSACISALHYFYMKLIRPVERFIHNKRIIVIPDEEINVLPFEAFLREAPGEGKCDFDGLHFLLEDYIISHAYSASLLPDPATPGRRATVVSFSPSYGTESGFDSLGGAVQEIRNINALMSGRSHTFDKATKSMFLSAIKDSVIFHLAMHSVSDTANSLYSYLLFSTETDSNEEARLYNYEVSLNKIISPMIVLSSCNSGTGNLYSGEGQLSLARSFILAGASSVVRTAWEVNDDSGSEIITRFYYYLSKGRNKDEALRMAKVDFLKKSPPVLRNPYYWAAYEILGDNGPIINKDNRIVTFVTILVLISVSALFFYFRRRRILPDGSL